MKGNKRGGKKSGLTMSRVRIFELSPICILGVYYIDMYLLILNETARLIKIKWLCAIQGCNIIKNIFAVCFRMKCGTVFIYT